jgi:hypothetical protein
VRDNGQTLTEQVGHRVLELPAIVQRTQLHLLDERVRGWLFGFCLSFSGTSRCQKVNCGD